MKVYNLVKKFLRHGTGSIQITDTSSTEKRGETILYVKHREEKVAPVDRGEINNVKIAEMSSGFDFEKDDYWMKKKVNGFMISNNIMVIYAENPKVAAS